MATANCPALVSVWKRQCGSTARNDRGERQVPQRVGSGSTPTEDGVECKHRGGGTSRRPRSPKTERNTSLNPTQGQGRGGTRRPPNSGDPERPPHPTGVPGGRARGNMGKRGVGGGTPKYS
eukprot:gene13808-biopygen17048